MNDSHHYDRSHMFHSSSHARMAQGQPFSAPRPQSFGQRTDINRNRSSVRGYGHSMVGQGYIHRDVTPRTGGYSQARGDTQPLPRPSSLPPRSFREPPTRYNPFN